MPDPYNVEIVDNIFQPVNNPHEDRITAILQKRAQPQSYTSQQIGAGTEAAQYMALAGRSNQGVEQILDAIVRKPQQELMNNEYESARGLYDLFEEKRARGDKQAQALFDKISLFTGDDPEGTAMFVEQLHADPEPIDPGNAFQVMTKLAGISKKTGYRPLDTRLKEAQISASHALASQRSSGGGSGSSVFAQTMAAIDSDPTLKNLSTIEKIRIAQNKVGTNLTIGADGEITDMEGAAEGLGKLKFGETLGKERATTYAEGEKSLPKLQSRVTSATDSNERVVQKIEQVESRAGLNTAGIGGVMLSQLPGSEARDVQADLQTIKANIGFDELQEMRENSPTGGALGQVAVQEIEFLQSVLANLEQDQSVEQFKRNLGEAKSAIKQSNQRIIEAYNRDIERFGQQVMPDVGVPITAPPMQSPSSVEDPIDAELRRRGAL
jgi:hypothetical protein